MKCLVVGGHGFIGSHVVAALASAGHEVTVYGRPSRLPLAPRLSGVNYVEGEVRDAYRLRRYVADAAIVIHLAGTSIPQSSVEDPFRDLEVNVGDTLHLLEACREEGVQRLVFVSSGGTVYGPARAVPISEDHPTEPISSYGVNKLATEKYIAMFHHLYGLDYVILRPSNAYGEFQNFFRRQGIIGVFLHRIAMGQEVTVWGSGDVARDYIYAGDLADAIVRAAIVPLEHRVFNVGNGQGTTINELLDTMRTVTGRQVTVRYEAGRALDVPVNALDSTRAHEELSWFSTVSLFDGINRTWTWIKRISREDH